MERGLISYIKDSINKVIEFKDTEYGVDWTCRFDHKLIRKAQIFANKVFMKFDSVIKFHIDYNVTEHECDIWSKSLTIYFDIKDELSQVDQIIIQLSNSWSSKNIEVKLLRTEYDECHDQYRDLVIQSFKNGELRL